jgi:ubiquinone/menaquinone biosynthesis C-methylase UbiE
MPSHSLPSWVRCPACRASLEGDSELHCVQCKARYEVKDGIPILLDEETRKHAEEHAAKEDFAGYHAARHVAPANIQYYDYWVDDLLRRVPGKKHERVIELMAGGAEVSRRARSLPKPIVAIDINHGLLAMSKDELLPDIVPVCASAEQLPFEDASIDLVLIQGGLHHVRKRVAGVVKEIARVMAKGATLIASEPRNDNLFNRAFRRAFYHLHPIPEADEEDGFTEREMRDLLGDAGLSLRQYDPFAYLGYMLIGNTDLVPVLARMQPNAISSSLIALDRACTRLPLARGLGWASQIVAEKN